MGVLHIENLDFKGSKLIFNGICYESKANLNLIRRGQFFIHIINIQTFNLKFSL